MAKHDCERHAVAQPDSLSLLARDISRWIDDHGRIIQRITADEWRWHRVMKVCEESGEVYAALHNLNGGNPRKPATTVADVIDELLDTAAAALCAVEHLTGNQGHSGKELFRRLGYTAQRAGLNGV